MAVLLPAVALLASGCATKDWVRQVVGEKEAQADQRFVKVEDRVGSEAQRLDAAAQRLDSAEGRLADAAQRVEGMGFRVATIEKSVAEVGEVAKGARSRADEAFSRADEVDARVTKLWSSRNTRNSVDTLHVQFGFNRADLDDGAQTALVALVRELQQNPKLSVDLEGYTDPTGTRDYNLQLAQRRVEAVRRYLVEKGVELPRINSIGLGPLQDKATPDVKKRRVTVKLLLYPD
jgi:outer membrane protein OmpA-like peptidoglycan-associated protein